MRTFDVVSLMTLRFTSEQTGVYNTRTHSVNGKGKSNDISPLWPGKTVEKIFTTPRHTRIGYTDYYCSFQRRVLEFEGLNRLNDRGVDVLTRSSKGTPRVPPRSSDPCGWSSTHWGDTSGVFLMRFMCCRFILYIELLVKGDVCWLGDPKSEVRRVNKLHLLRV